MNKQTPGPWEINDTNGAGDLFIAPTSDEFGNSLAIAIISSGALSRSVEEVFANARLITAACTLLDRTARALGVDAVELCGMDLEGLIREAGWTMQHGYGHRCLENALATIPEAADADKAGG